MGTSVSPRGGLFAYRSYNVNNFMIKKLKIIISLVIYFGFSWAVSVIIMEIGFHTNFKFLAFLGGIHVFVPFFFLQSSMDVFNESYVLNDYRLWFLRYCIFMPLGFAFLNILFSLIIFFVLQILQ